MNPYNNNSDNRDNDNRWSDPNGNINNNAQNNFNNDRNGDGRPPRDNNIDYNNYYVNRDYYNNPYNNSNNNNNNNQPGNYDNRKNYDNNRIPDRRRDEYNDPHSYNYRDPLKSDYDKDRNYGNGYDDRLDNFRRDPRNYHPHDNNANNYDQYNYRNSQNHRDEGSYYINSGKPPKKKKKVLRAIILSLILWASSYILLAILYSSTLSGCINYFIFKENVPYNDKIDSVEIDSSSILPEYYDDYIAPAGMQFIVNYSDGNTEILDLTSDMLVDYDSTARGYVRISFKYEGRSSSFIIKILDKSLVDVSIFQESVEEYYYATDDFPDSILLLLAFSDGSYSTLPVNDKMIDEYSPSKHGTQSLKITYYGFETELEILLVAKATQLSILHGTFKTEYLLNEEFEGGKIQAKYTDGTAASVNVTVDMLDWFDSSIPGIYQLYIYHKGATASIKVVVNGGPALYNNEFLVNFNFDSLYYEIIGYEGSSTVVNFPHQINGLPIGYIRPDILTDVILQIKELSIPFIGKYVNLPSTFDYLYDENNVTIAEYLSNETVIPQITLNFLPNYLSSIPESTFKNDKLVKNVIIPYGIVSIEKQAFSGSFIRSVSLPQSLDEIADYAFEKTYYLKFISIPRSVSYVGLAVFSGSNLKYIIINSTSRLYNFYRFSANCVDLKIILPDYVHSMYSKNNLSYAFISHDVIKLSDLNTIDGDYLIETTTNTLLYYFGDATEIVIPTSINGIGPYAFAFMPEIVYVQLHSHVYTINDYAFYGDINITNVYLPEFVMRIGNYAFDGTSISTIYIPKSITNLGINFFNGDIIILGSVCSDFIFAYKLDAIYVLYNQIVDYTTLYPEFADLFKIYYPELIDNESNPEAGMLITYDELILFYGTQTEVVIPDNVTTVSNYAFKDCYYLESIVLSQKTSVIGGSAFENCIALSTISLSDLAQLTEIKANSFKNCNNLELIDLRGTAINKIAANAFFGCSSSLVIYLDNNEYSNFENDWNLIGYDSSGEPIYANVFYEE
ncbi:MAG: leucine-rich repeat domain-containing protein [Christensenellaceae bacterium]|jgi:hypothetical protein|nr:leucine-rich repeat domain-containing protein [Christensenellaceae bacterium]